MFCCFRTSVSPTVFCLPFQSQQDNNSCFKIIEEIERYIHLPIHISRILLSTKINSFSLSLSLPHTHAFDRQFHSISVSVVYNKCQELLLVFRVFLVFQISSGVCDERVRTLVISYDIYLSLLV